MRMTQTRRALNACEFCRSRKIKCDEKKPTCSHCEKRGYKCVYKTVAPTKLEKTLTELFSKVHSIDTKLSSLVEDVEPYLKHDRSELDTTASAPPVMCQSPSFNVLSSTPVDVKAHDLYPKESFLISPLNPKDDNFAIDSWLKSDGLSGTSDSFFNSKLMGVGIFKESNGNPTSEFITENNFTLAGRFDPSLMPSILSFPQVTVDKYIRSYLEHIYPRYPAICEKYISRVCSKVSRHGIRADLSTCIFLLILALGAATENDTHGSDFQGFWDSLEYQDPTVSSIQNLPPGWKYFWIALGIRDRALAIHKPNIEVIVVRLLSSVYYLKICNIFGHWKELVMASDTVYDCLSYYLKFEPQVLRETSELSDALLRDFWIVLHLEHQVADVFDLRTTKLVELQGNLNLPRGCTEPLFRERSSIYSFCFMSIISLTNLRKKARSHLSKVNSRSFEEVLDLIENLNSELQEWRRLLPLEFQWEDYYPALTPTDTDNPEILLMRMNYHSTFIAITMILLIKIRNFEHVKLCFSSLKISDLLESCLLSVSQYVDNFLQLSLEDLTPFLCHESMQVLMLMDKLRYLADYGGKKDTDTIEDITERTFRSQFNCLRVTKPLISEFLKRIAPFTRHSPFIRTEYEHCLSKYAK